MDEKQVRLAILDALDASYVSLLMQDESIREKFLTGNINYRFEELDMDSLAMMEFCISLELNDIISITPDEVLALESLDQLIFKVLDKN